MQELEDRIRHDGIVKAGNVLKVDAFLNHQCDVELFEQTGPLGAHVVEQLNVALVVEEGINLKDVTGLYDAVMANTILKLLHGATPSRGKIPRD